MIEVRWHGRGGQGVVTASDLLAKAAIAVGKYAVHFPMFGPERTGAPVLAFTRIDDKPIEIHCGVYNPDIVVVIDPTLVGDVEWVTGGLKQGGTLVINSTSPPEELLKKAKELDAKVYYVDAYTIAMDVFKKPFYNTPMLGALVKVTGIVPLDAVLTVVEKRFPGKVAELNKEAIKRSYEEVKVVEG